MLRTLTLVTALALILSSGVVHGVWTGRWSASQELQAKIARLDRVPNKIGDWEGRPLTLDARSIERADISGYLCRRYVNQKTGGAVTVMLVCGRPGPISVHTPEVCYAGTGYEQSGETVRFPIGSDLRDVFWEAEFNKSQSIVPEHLRILYSWSADGTWKASDNPRWDFGGLPALLKLYVIREKAEKRGKVQADDSEFEFVRQLVPELRNALFWSK
jgi:Protein of unknown function (DUF3485)